MWLRARRDRRVTLSRLCLGVYWLVVVPSPSCPWALNPQAQSVPSPFTATVWNSPTATDANPVPTCLGEGCWTVIPSPSWPL